MNQPQRICARCGAPAVLRRGGQGKGHDRIRDLCEECAALEWNTWGIDGEGGGQLPTRVEFGIVLVAIGVFSILISTFADWLEFGRSPGLGWKQMIGIGLAAFVIMLGAMFRTLFLVILGLIFGGLSILADWAGFGSDRGFGYQQMAGVVAGAILIAGGMRLARTTQSEPEEKKEGTEPGP